MKFELKKHRGLQVNIYIAFYCSISQYNKLGKFTIFVLHRMEAGRFKYCLKALLKSEPRLN